MRSLISRIFPAPRRVVAWWRVWPLALVLLALGLAVLLLPVRFTTPWAFAWLVVLPWVWWLQVAGWGGLGGWRGTASVVVRLTLLAVLIAALAQPRAVRFDDRLALLYLLDTSDSIGDGVIESARGWMLKTVQGKPARDDAGLIAFARDAAVELPPRQAFPFEGFATKVRRDGTDLEQALSLAAAVLPEDRPGRIVVVGDGVATQGTLDRALDQLVQRGIPVDVLPVQYDHKDEVWVERLDLPTEVRPGETYEAAVLLASLRPGDGALVLRENGREIARSTVSWPAGKSRLALPLKLRGPGYYEYVAAVEPTPGKDGIAENNLAMGSIHLDGEGRILVLVDPEGRTEDATAFVAALGRTTRRVEVVTARECPDDPLALLPYEAVVLLNVPADQMDVAQQTAVRDAVANQGLGLLMVGGKNGFGPGGWNRTPIEEALPVTMDISTRKVLPKGALVVVLHTCEFGDGNTWAKRITKQAIKVLGARDEVGAVDFDMGGRYQWIFPLTPAGEYEKLVPLIEAANPSDMPDFNATFQLAHDGLAASDAATKHIIVISDGDPSPPSPALIQQLVAAKITVSTVTIAPHGNQEVAAYRMIADVTGGRSYFPQDPAALPAIFIKEAKTLKRSQIQNKTFVPSVTFPSPILKGIAALPPLHGYVLTTPRSRAQVVLEGPDPDEEDPVLATWRFGAGAAAAFTADLAPNWGRDWVAWDRYQAFVEQLITAVARGRNRSQLRLQAVADGNDGRLTAIDLAPEKGFLDVVARVRPPEGEALTVPLVQIAPGRYAGRFPLSGKGRYQVVAVGSGGAAESGGEPRAERALGGFAVAYSREYLRFRADPAVAERIAERTGGRVLTGNEDGAALFGAKREPRASSRPIAEWLLAALAGLLLIDVALRRIQIDWAVVAGWFKRSKAGPSTEAMGSLLAAKSRAVKAGPESGVRAQPVRAMGPIRPAATSATSATSATTPSGTATSPTKGEGAAPMTDGEGTAPATMDRLLAAKRRRNEKPGDKS